MSINFNGISSNATTNNRTKATETGNASGSVPVVKDDGNSASTGSGDNVSLSGEAKALQALEEQIKNLPVTDQNKVDHFRSEIANGNYQPNPENIATKMLDADKQF